MGTAITLHAQPPCTPLPPHAPPLCRRRRRVASLCDKAAAACWRAPARPLNGPFLPSCPCAPIAGPGDVPMCSPAPPYGTRYTLLPAWCPRATRCTPAPTPRSYTFQVRNYQLRQAAMQWHCSASKLAAMPRCGSAACSHSTGLAPCVFQRHIIHPVGAAPPLAQVNLEEAELVRPFQWLPPFPCF